MERHIEALGAIHVCTNTDLHPTFTCLIFL